MQLALGGSLEACTLTRILSCTVRLPYCTALAVRIVIYRKKYASVGGGVLSIVAAHSLPPSSHNTILALKTLHYYANYCTI